MEFYIVEKSFLARIARCFLKSTNAAIVFGKGIHLSGVSKEEFLRDPKWLKHELVHIKQYKKYGIVRFIILYLTESFKKGYYQNKFEIEARKESETHS